MTQYQIVGFYAALNALVIIWLAVNVGRARSKAKVSLGDGGNPELLRAIRAHGNNIEYTPIALILLFGLASLQVSTLLLHILGSTYVAGRILHGIGLSRTSGISFGRMAGTALTMLTIFVSALYLLYLTVYYPQIVSG